MSKKTEPMPRMCLHCDAATADRLKKIAISEGITTSELIRRLLRQGIEANGFQEDEAQLQARITASVREVMKPYIERLAAISAKSAQISGASFFMDALLFRLLFPDNQKDTITQAAVKARQVGAEYMGLKTSNDLDAFITEIMRNERMR